MERGAAPADLADLLARSALGDRHAFAELYRHTSGKLYGLAMRVVRRSDLAEEVLQDAFINIWRHAGDFRPERAGAFTWMAAVVRNRALDLLRAAPREDSLGDDESPDDWAGDDPGPLDQAVASDEARALLNCLERLMPRERQVISLSYFRGLTHEELARHIEEPLGSVKTWIRRGLQQLRRCMGTA